MLHLASFLDMTKYYIYFKILVLIETKAHFDQDESTHRLFDFSM